MYFIDEQLNSINHVCPVKLMLILQGVSSCSEIMFHKGRAIEKP